MQIDIEARPENVWPYLVEPAKAMEWRTTLKRFDWTSEPGGIGSTFYWLEEASGREYNINFETTDWGPDGVFACRMTEGDFLKSYDGRWTLDEIDGGCRFTFNEHIVFPYGPIGRIIGYFAARHASAERPENLENLKRIVEARAHK